MDEESEKSRYGLCSVIVALETICGWEDTGNRIKNVTHTREVLDAQDIDLCR